MDRIRRERGLFDESLQNTVLGQIAHDIVKRRPDASEESWRSFFGILRSEFEDPADWPQMLRWAIKDAPRPPSVWTELANEWRDEQLELLALMAYRPDDQHIVSWFVQTRLLANVIEDGGYEAVAERIGVRVSNQPEWLPYLLRSVSASSGERPQA